MPQFVDRIISRLARPASPVSFRMRAGDAFPLDQLQSADGKPPPPPAPGERLVIWFYPKDNTPGCTLEGRHFTRMADAFRAKNTRVYGCSADDASAHQHFQDSCDIRTDLLTDPRGRVGQRLGNFRDTFHQRTTAVLDDQCRLLRLYDQVAPLGHPEEVLRDLG
jgi:peroxiredoxin Q/BCP